MWPQLEEIVREYLRSVDPTPVFGLLFPSTVEPGQPITDLRKALDANAIRVGWKRGAIRPYAFRHIGAGLYIGCVTVSCLHQDRARRGSQTQE